MRAATYASLHAAPRAHSRERGIALPFAYPDTSLMPTPLPAATSSVCPPCILPPLERTPPCQPAASPHSSLP